MKPSSYGTIFQIQHSCTHDGDGLRTTVFLKGCPLHCQWCANPESQSALPELMYHPQHCLGCHACMAACRNHAICFQGSLFQWDSAVCLRCGICTDACIYHALSLAGKRWHVDDVVAECRKDYAFYTSSQGGVTLSGGEPFFQAEFTLQLLEALKAEGISTAVETTGYTTPEILLQGTVDHFLYDFKCIDEAKHLQYTGVSNARIKENLKTLCRCRRVTVRIPVIPGINTDEKDLCKTGRFLRDAGASEVHLLPYHTLGVNKYTVLRKPYLLPGIQPPSSKEMFFIQDLLTSYGLHVEIS